jgi:predicted NBD/HSP70 family sugar kinase
MEPVKKSLTPPRFGSRGRALELIRSQGPISRIELAQSTGLTQATISHVVRSLIGDGLVLEIGRGEPTGGKPRMMLEINPDARLGIGVQLGLESIVYVVVNLSGSVIGRLRTKGAGDRQPAEVVATMAADIATLLDGLGVDRSLVVGVGLVSPGPIDRENGVIFRAPSLVSWSGYSLRAEFEAATGLRVSLDNDATAAALGEHWLGATSDSRAYTCIYMATGIGAGIVIDGTIYRGVSSNVGELGHVTVDIRGELCSCGNRGCLELVASPSAIVARAAAAVAGGELDLRLTGTTQRDLSTLGMAAMRGNVVAYELLEDAADILAAGIVSMMNLFDLELVVLAGSAFASTASIYLDRVQHALDTYALSRESHRIKVQLSANVHDAAALGAATLVLQEQLDPRSLRSVSIAGVA